MILSCSFTVLVVAAATWLVGAATISIASSAIIAIRVFLWFIFCLSSFCGLLYITMYSEFLRVIVLSVFWRIGMELNLVNVFVF